MDLFYHCLALAVKTALNGRTGTLEVLLQFLLFNHFVANSKTINVD